MPAIESAPEWMVPADEVILEELSGCRLDYVPLVAGRCGIHLAYAERRFRVLDDHGLIERATPEETYRITRRGERYLAGTLDASALETGSTS